MKGLLRYFDRRLLAAIALVLVAVFAARATWIGSSQSRLEAAQTEKAAAESDLSSFQTRLAEIRSDGVSTGVALLQRVARLEVLVQAQNDVLTISANFIAIAESSGAVLESFAPVATADAYTEATAARILRGTRYGFTTSGRYDAVATFLENIVASSRFVATIDSVSLSSAGADAGMFGESVSVSGDVLVWSLVDKPLTNPVVVPSPIGGGSAASAPTTLPGDPSSVTTLPGDPSSVTTLPGAPTTPTTLPTTPTTLPAGNESASGLDPRFGSCDEAIAEGFGPYVDGDDPEYEFYADEDANGEGVVCAG